LIPTRFLPDGKTGGYEILILTLVFVVAIMSAGIAI
jgi:hypothetical protein